MLFRSQADEAGQEEQPHCPPGVPEPFHLRRPGGREAALTPQSRLVCVVCVRAMCACVYVGAVCVCVCVCVMHNVILHANFLHDCFGNASFLCPISCCELLIRRTLQQQQHTQSSICFQRSVSLSPSLSHCRSLSFSLSLSLSVSLVLSPE